LSGEKKNALDNKKKKEEKGTKQRKKEKLSGETGGRQNQELYNKEVIELNGFNMKKRLRVEKELIRERTEKWELKNRKPPGR